MDMLTRRDLLKMGVIGAGGYLSFPHDRAFARPSSSFLDNPRSPRTTPFVQPLPLPDPPNQAEFSEAELAEIPDEYKTPITPSGDGSDPARCGPMLGPNTRLYKIVSEQRLVKFHPDLPLTSLWGYRDFNVAPSEFVLVPAVIEP